MEKRPGNFVSLCLALFLMSLMSLSSCKGGGQVSGNFPEEKALLDTLDASVRNRKRYFARKEETIRQLHGELSAAASDSARLEILGALGEAFLSYRFDSAFHYVRLKEELISESPDFSKEEKAKVLFDKVLVFTSAGLFKEATDILEVQDILSLSSETKKYALWVASKTYYDLTAYTYSVSGVDSIYREKTLSYSRSLLSMLSKDSWMYNFVRGHERIMAGDLQGATRSFETILGMSGVPSHSRSISEAILGDLYSEKGEEEKSLVHYARSAILDLHNATRENTSLIKLSRLLFGKGDLDRSYLYAQTALEDATFYNAYHRKIDVADILPLIENRRYILLDIQKNTLSSGLILVVALCVALIVLSLIVFGQVKKLRRAHRTIAAHNASLSAINRELMEVNTIKDEYIGLSFFNDSSHIKKLEGLYRFVGNKLRDKKYADIKEAFDPKELQKERENMYENFDVTFLRLFPNFIDRYNALFPPEERERPSSGRLTTEMRIFALIRLGISKSDDIAGFLDYSVHTINTYKTRVKNKSSLDNALFEDAILAIDARL